MNKTIELTDMYGTGGLDVATTNLGELHITVDTGDIEVSGVYLDKEAIAKLTLFMIDLLPDIDMIELNRKSLTELQYLQELVEEAIALKDKQ